MSATLRHLPFPGHETLAICALAYGDDCEAVEFLERQKRSNTVHYKGMMALLRHLAGTGLPLYNKKKAEMVGTRPPKEIAEIKNGNLRLFGFIDPRRPRVMVLTHGWMKSQGNTSRQNTQIAAAEEILARYRQMPEIPIE